MANCQLLNGWKQAVTLEDILWQNATLLRKAHGVSIENNERLEELRQYLGVKIEILEDEGNRIIKYRKQY